MEIGKRSWDLWIEEALPKVESLNMFIALRPMRLPTAKQQGQEVEEEATSQAIVPNEEEYETFQGVQPWDRLSVQISIPESFFQRLLNGEEFTTKYERDDNYKVSSSQQQYKKLVLFAGNDFLALGRHPAIAKATIKAAAEHGTGPRGSPLVCGYTDYHIALESGLAQLKKKEACLLCPTGFSANMAAMVAIGSIAPLLCEGGKPTMEEKIAVFSNSLNHASIVDGLQLAKQHGGLEIFVYKHCDPIHLDALLTSCKMEKKVVVTDSLFSMDGDFAPMVELIKLRKKHGFLLVVDDAHGSFVFGKNGGGVTEEFNCQDEVDIVVGTLSKGAASIGGFIACSKIWKQFIQSRGRAFIFSAAHPVPLAAATYASLVVARNEPWRRLEVRKRIREFQALTGIPVASQVLSVIIGTKEKTWQVNRELLTSGFYVVAIGPPVANTWRLRVTLTAAHTTEDIQKLVKIISNHVKFEDMENYNPNLHVKAKL
ncbi:Aminotransferase, class I/classII [Corchorus olitorius]|uniref:Aminotransferase, class I/classII n=1 Tax=Corchorus olitorius TaxID=93759 RepID=A0A1R3JTS0_9ROSI|nr:Aminotransferase, class I/classII [Corchorus olitorius]